MIIILQRGGTEFYTYDEFIKLMTDKQKKIKETGETVKIGSLDSK